MTFDESQVARDRVGQFAEKRGSAPELSLSADDALIVPFTARWTERGVVPPRARKPRDVSREMDVAVGIPMVSEDAAPVALSFEGDRFMPGEYRVHNGQLYAATDRFTDDAVSLFESHGQNPYSDGGSESEVAAGFQEKADRYLVIGDRFWATADEPVYAVTTYGMGGNHGSTALGLDSLTRYKTEDGSPVHEWVFPVDQREAAIEKALSVAAERGDTKSLDRIKDAPVVHIGTGFKPGSTFSQPSRIKYRAAYELGYGATSEDVEEAFTEFKSQILTIPGAVRDVPDGWGGTTKRVDLTKLTDRQRDDYHEYVKRVEGFTR